MNLAAKDLRICVASTGLGHVMRGVEGWAHDLGHALARRGHNVLLCKGDGEATAPFERVVSCWTRRSEATERLLRWLPKSLGWRVGLGNAYNVEQTTFAWNLLGILRRERVDVLHLKDPQVALLVQRAARMGLCQTRVLFGHGTEEPIESLVQLEHVHHLAPWHQDEAESVLGAREGWCTIPNFVDTDRFRPTITSTFRREWSIPEDGLVVTVCSAIKRQHKRLDCLIEEFSMVQQQRPDLPVWFVIAGGRSQESDQLIEFGRAKLGDRVRFVPELSRDRMPEFHATGDVFVHGSLFEMFGTVMAEALACGVPCIIHEHPVMQWVVGPGGIAIDMRVAGNVAMTLVRLLDQETLRKQMGVAGQAYCRDRFDQDRVIDQTVEQYAKISRRKAVAA
ncbi:glycosyltransferase family 4 protein [Aporhodopirellula aestuarii]|uniref:Glycosyltransferase family 4 protein n=1 Tax=Aporhodopirellula aestuarii TaxID=2950107 RepID=A0ABT0UCT6_9BACT|nr:glycosyltransferase family 4 protein [Aporhodopirellula aestuarii]MCM2374832.1 glycosyltransferase family 4 protein [Aporhodopirellula aestuarii]